MKIGTAESPRKTQKLEEDISPSLIEIDLMKNKKPVMNMELRFKGGFTSQPQFFGTMTREFKNVLKGECL